MVTCGVIFKKHDNDIDLDDRKERERKGKVEEGESSSLSGLIINY